MTENQNQNQLTLQEKLQVAMGLKPAPANFDMGISEEYLGKWRMFFRGSENNLLGVNILSDYFVKIWEENGGRLPENLSLNNDRAKTKFINYFKELVAPSNENEEANEYLNELSILNIDLENRVIPQDVSNGLDFFGKIFAGVGILSAVTEDERVSIFKSSLGAEGFKLWETNFENDTTKFKKPEVFEVGNLPATPGESQTFETSGGDFGGEETSEGGDMQINQENHTQFDAHIDEEDQTEETITEPTEEHTEEPPRQDAEEVQPEAQQIPQGLPTETQESVQPEIMPEQLEYQMPYGAEAPYYRGPAFGRVSPAEGSEIRIPRGTRLGGIAGLMPAHNRPPQTPVREQIQASEQQQAPQTSEQQQVSQQTSVRQQPQAAGIPTQNAGAPRITDSSQGGGQMEASRARSSGGFPIKKYLAGAGIGMFFFGKAASATAAATATAATTASDFIDLIFKFL